MTVLRKLDTFRQHPIRSFRSRRRQVIYQLVTRLGRYHLARAGVMAALEAFQAVRPASAFPPQYADLWFLYRMVRRRRPAVVWEFGSGNSTVVLAHALITNGVGHLSSIETDDEWAHATACALPTYLQRVCRVMYSPVDKVPYQGRAAYRHRVLPDSRPNFAYLDSGWPVFIDLLCVEDQLPADFYLVIDDRQENTQFLRQHFTRRYRFTRRRLVVQQVFELVP